MRELDRVAAGDEVDPELDARVREGAQDGAQRLHRAGLGDDGRPLVEALAIRPRLDVLDAEAGLLDQRAQPDLGLEDLVRGIAQDLDGVVEPRRSTRRSSCSTARGLAK